MMSGRHQVVREILAHCFMCWRREAPVSSLLPPGPSSAPEPCRCQWVSVRSWPGGRG